MVCPGNEQDDRRIKVARVEFESVGLRVGVAEVFRGSLFIGKFDIWGEGIDHRHNV